MRAKLCNLSKDGKLDSLKNDYKEIDVFVRFYEKMGAKCEYLLSICEVIETIPVLMKKLELLK